MKDRTLVNGLIFARYFNSTTSSRNRYCKFTIFFQQTCGKTFAYSHVLTGHMMTHTGEKRHQCPTCGKRFTKRHHLKSHLNTHLKALSKASMIPTTVSQNQQTSQEQTKHEVQRTMQNDDQNVDLMNVEQLGFQVINTEKY